MAAMGGNKRMTIREGKKEEGEEGILTRLSARVSESPIVYRSREAASEAAYVAKRLAKSTGKAAWIAGTTLLILVVPLIIEIDREQQLNDLDMQQATLLGTPSSATTTISS